MQNLFTPWAAGSLRPMRAVEATPEQVAAVGAWGNMAGLDPVDGDRGWRALGSQGRSDVPEFTRQKAIAYSLTAYRVNPMARAIIDTYTGFCVGDKGVTWTSTNADVSAIIDEYTSDPMVNWTKQALGLRSALLYGESLRQFMVGTTTGVVRWSPIDPRAITRVVPWMGNPMWPDLIVLGNNTFWDPAMAQREFSAIRVDDASGLRSGEIMLWAPFKSVETDTRSSPFLFSVLDWLDNYDTVLSNLMDRTALARYVFMDVSVAGGQDRVDEFVERKGGQLQLPPTGAMEVHTDSVKYTPMHIQVGADEDSATSKLALTSVAAGSGLARTWLADPEDANRATSLSMAEPVRRRVAAIQLEWLDYQTEILRFVADQAVRAGRLPYTVDATDPRTGQQSQVAPAQTIMVTGPEVAAADSSITAQVLLNLSQALVGMVEAGIMTQPAAEVAAIKAWEDYMGVPYRADLGGPDANQGDVASYVDDQQGQATPPGKGQESVLRRLTRVA